MNNNEHSVNIQFVMLQAVEGFLREKITADSVHASLLHAAMHYSLDSGGKRLRPLICMGMAQAICGDFKKAVAPAAAIECIHTYSLIHDDLPCMDNDDYRRGKPTLHKMYNEWMALLAGDALLTNAFELVCEGDGITAENRVAMVRIIAKAAGSNGMVAGQAADMQGDAADDESKLNYIHRNKTGQLLRAAAICGAIAADGQQHEIDIAARFGNAFGMAFQITDDIIDATASLGEAGKCTGKDAQAGKTTFVTCHGVAKAEQMARSYVDEAISLLEKLGDGSGYLQELAMRLVDRKR